MEAGDGVATGNPSSDDSLRNLELQARVKFREKRFREILSPLEGYILQLQSLLVWEKPRRSALMFIIINVVFWLASTTQYRIVFLAAVCAIIYVCVETVHSKVWPEIRVPPTDPEDEEGWTPVHPDLLSLPELCQYLGKIWVHVEDYWARFWQLRHVQPAKFCLYLSSTCLLLAAIGHHISGLILTYLILMGLLLWPCLEYHQITKHIYQKLRPILKQFEHSVEQTSYQARRPRVSARRGQQTYSAARRELLGESDSELEDFCPTPNPARDAAFAQAATMSSCNTPSMGSLRATPISMLSSGVMPRGMSIDDDGQTTDTEGASFMAGLSSMPAHDDDHMSADELDIELPRDSHAPSTRETPPLRITASPPSDIKFVSTHFRDSSSDDDLGLSEDVRIPNYDTFDKRERRPHSSGEALSASLPPAAAQLLSNTVASVMQDAVMSSIGQLTQADNDTVDRHRHTATAQQYSPRSDISHSAQHDTQGDTHSDKQIVKPRLAATDSAELAEQFEMLDQSELASLENEPPSAASDQSGASGGSMARLSDYGMGLINSWWPGKK